MIDHDELRSRSNLPGSRANRELVQQVVDTGSADDFRALLAVLERLTEEPRDRTLRKALGYCWSVAVAAGPEQGLPVFARLRGRDDPDVRWIVAENLKKKRLQKLGPLSEQDEEGGRKAQEAGGRGEHQRGLTA